MNRLAVLMILCAAYAGAARAVAADPPERLSLQRQREILREALNLFDDAVGSAYDDPTEARRRFRRAATHFETLADAGVRNAALEYNLGNTYMRLADLGRAVLHYRRAQRLEPAGRAVAANLRYARNRVEPFIAPTGQSRLLHNLLFWQYSTTARQRFWAAAAFSGVGWLLMIVRLRRRNMPLFVLACACILLGAANAGLVLWEQHQDATAPPAVLVDGEHFLRTGGGENYEPKIQRPLGSGVELRVLGRRGEWVEVELRDESSGWIEAAAIQRI
ncbi:MAG: hypothetical protein IH986_07960 [Planctomycetes bacterium]|nr:hypothetical protein [Planctomycetota bacterium]